jgi:(1->4)-alpha-D-glucan 1-alpha-D-glucosylmutase
VDYDERRRLLRRLDGEPGPETILDRMDEGLPKLWLTRQALHLRRQRPELFGAGGDYLPLTAREDREAHVFAFARGGGAVTVVPRLSMKLAGDWRETSLKLPDGRWHNELTGEETDGGEVRLADLLRRFPVALLSRLA